MGKPEKPTMRLSLRSRLDHMLEWRLPEQRLFLKSDRNTRFKRLRPTTQAFILFGTSVVAAWMVFATAAVFLNVMNAGNTRDQVVRSQAIYEARIEDLSRERDARTEDASQALERFNLALAQMSEMQSEVLRLEEQNRELKRGLTEVRSTLRDAIEERDTARETAQLFKAELERATGNQDTSEGRLAEAEMVQDFLTDALDEVALERDEAIIVADAARSETDVLETRIERMVDRNAQIFARLEEAIEVSLDPLDSVFRAAGLPVDRLLNEVRQGYTGQGGPHMPITVSTRGDPLIDGETARANDLLNRMERVDVYRLAAERSPLDHPVRGSYRQTSPFGPRWGRMHNGIDYAGPHGTDIVSTADGVVTHAGWLGAYGYLIKVKHAFGFETRYAHLTRIRVQVGQRVSRGQHIGDMGSTGRSTGTHLHYEIRSNGRALNPQPFVRAGRNVF